MQSLGQKEGALTDLRAVLKQEPNNADAARELKDLEASVKAKGQEKAKRVLIQEEGASDSSAEDGDGEGEGDRTRAAFAAAPSARASASAGHSDTASKATPPAPASDARNKATGSTAAAGVGASGGEPPLPNEAPRTAFEFAYLWASFKSASVHSKAKFFRLIPPSSLPKRMPLLYYYIIVLPYRTNYDPSLSLFKYVFV